jgi:hypothetical protein
MVDQPEQTTRAFRAMGASAEPQKSESVFASLLASALTEHEIGADLGTLLLAAMGAPDAKGQPLASELEMRNPAEFMLMNQVFVPMMQKMLPMSLFGVGGGAGAAASAEDVALLRQELAALSELVKTQSTTINQLKKGKK